jgi:periplasmic divalent cation tolerance protein
MSAALIYITAPSREEALRIGRVLVEERLAACANVHSPITSVYWWEGAVQEDGEVALVAKTRRDLVDRLAARARELHSYSCPCVVAVDIAGGNPAFLAWIDQETRE